MQNIVILAGTIRQAPETRTTRSGTDITRFKLVTARPRYSEGRVVRDEKGYRVEDAEWHRVVAFSGLGRTIRQYCDSGTKVLVRGRIHYTKWQDAEGQDRYGCEIVAETVDFFSRAPQSENNDDEDEGRFIDEDDIPT